MTESEQPTRTFDAPGHMRKIRTRNGMQDYLDVKWRIAWLRAEFPTAQIVTEQIEGDADHARFSCRITLPNGAVGMGHGSETLQDFPDFYEKAETKAIGRACAVLGYGTDAASDFDDGEPMDGRAAAKDERKDRHMTDERANPGVAPMPIANTPPAPPEKSNVHQHAQLRALAEAGFDLSARMKPLKVESIEELTKEQAKELIIAGRAAVRPGQQG